jgi:hypothetical protein
MEYADYVRATARPYSSMLREVSVFGKLFSSKQLSFTMQSQTQTNWCWAATARSVSHFYWFLSSWTQCRVAGAELDREDCCSTPVPGPCNVPWYLDRALTRTKNFVSIQSGQASFSQIRAEIDAGRPVGARIGWSGGGGHFMVIYGYSRILATDYLDIDDPIYGKSHLTVADFASNYQGSGTWTHTYFTKSYKTVPIKILYPIEPILQRIWEVRPLLQLKWDPAFEGLESAESQAANVGGAVRVYVLGLDALTSRQGRRRPELVALRVYETAGDAPVAFFDVTEDEDPRVVQMSSAPAQLHAYSNALSQALMNVGDSEAELRLLRVPAVNFEGLWLSYDGDAEDVVIPMHPVADLPTYEPVMYDRVMEALRSAAEAVVDMDDTMGA